MKLDPRIKVRRAEIRRRTRLIEEHLVAAQRSKRCIALLQAEISRLENRSKTHAKTELDNASQR